MFNLNNLLPSRMKASQDSRKRFRISAFQVQSLEDVFKNNPRPCKEIQEEVAAQLNLPYRTVTIWFQNRRAKAKLIGEPIADHVFQWKPPVVATKSNQHPSKPSNISKNSQAPCQENSLETSQFLEQETSPEQDSLQTFTTTARISNSLGFQGNSSTTTNNQGNSWVPDSSYNNNDWTAGNSSMPCQSVDSASFISNFSTYEGRNFDMDFNNFLASQNNLNTQTGGLSSGILTSPEGFNPQQILAYPAGIFTPSLSQSAVSLSTQDTGSSGFFNDCSNSSMNTMPSEFYAHPQGMSVQSLPQFSGQGLQSLALANSLGLQHPTQSAPELAFHTNLPNMLHTATSRNPVQVKMQQERNNAMFFSMRS